MKSSKSTYWIMAILSGAGYAWIGFHSFLPQTDTIGLTVCLFKSITSVPCPSCGITRSVMFLLNGDFHGALIINPLGFVAAIALIIIPCWIMYDLITKRNSLAKSILWTEELIKSRKSVYIPLVALVLINWGWNILKEL